MHTLTHSLSHTHTHTYVYLSLIRAYIHKCGCRLWMCVMLCLASTCTKRAALPKAFLRCSAMNCALTVSVNLCTVSSDALFHIYWCSRYVFTSYVPYFAVSADWSRNLCFSYMCARLNMHDRSSKCRAHAHRPVSSLFETWGNQAWPIARKKNNLTRHQQSSSSCFITHNEVG